MTSRELFESKIPIPEYTFYDVNKDEYITRRPDNRSRAFSSAFAETEIHNRQYKVWKAFEESLSEMICEIHIEPVKGMQQFKEVTIEDKHSSLRITLNVVSIKVYED